MKRSIPILICTLFLFSCTRRVKTYHPNGKIATEYSLDNKGRKNGLFKVYNKNGILYRETEMIHDTMSGKINFYYDSGELAIIEYIERGLYNVTIADTDFNPRIQDFSNVEMKHYNKKSILDEYRFSTKRINDRCKFIVVKYKNDSISEIVGMPIWGLYKINKSSEGIIDQIRITGAKVPKCIRNFYLLDSTQKQIASCTNCDSILTYLDRRNIYSLKVEYIDSTFHVKHSIEEPLGHNNKKRFPNGLVINWTRE